MPKIIKQFTTEEYYKDYKYITNSHLLSFIFCPFLYQQKRKGKVVELEKDYFTYGKAVDTILSGEDINDKFVVGKKEKSSVEELRECIKVIEKEIQERVEAKKKVLKSQTDKIDKLNQKLDIAMQSEGKIAITSTVLGHVFDTAKEMQSQPLYKAFDKADPQTIIATEINGVKAKCMLDKLDLKNGIICDDKTTANMMTFNAEMYLQQLAWYRKIVREVYGIQADCYLTVADKNSNANIANGTKRSSFYYISPARLDYQEELNQEILNEFLEAKKKNKYKPCIINNPEMRGEKCFACSHYQACEHSRQKTFIIL